MNMKGSKKKTPNNSNVLHSPTKKRRQKTHEDKLGTRMEHCN